jgi:hypothetical protein
LTTLSAFLVALDGADAEPVVDHDLAAKDSSEDKHRAGLARITSSKVQSSRWSFANLFVERMANSAFSAISSLHSFVAYSLFQLPRLLLL